MKYQYATSGTCSQMIEIELDGDILQNVVFYGGCAGNTAGIASLVKGMKVEDVISRLQGIQCGFKGTSCPDQLARALRAAVNK